MRREKSRRKKGEKTTPSLSLSLSLSSNRSPPLCPAASTALSPPARSLLSLSLSLPWGSGTPRKTRKHKRTLKSFSSFFVSSDSQRKKVTSVSLLEGQALPLCFFFSLLGFHPFFPFQDARPLPPCHQGPSLLAATRKGLAPRRRRGDPGPPADVEAAQAVREKNSFPSAIPAVAAKPFFAISLSQFCPLIALSFHVFSIDCSRRTLSRQRGSCDDVDRSKMTSVLGAWAEREATMSTAAATTITPSFFFSSSSLSTPKKRKNPSSSKLSPKNPPHPPPLQKNQNQKQQPTAPRSRSSRRSLTTSATRSWRSSPRRRPTSPRTQPS